MILACLTRVREVEQRPELPALGVLDAAIDAAVLALAAAHPALDPFLEEPDDEPLEPRLAVANAITHHAEALRALLCCYVRLGSGPARSSVTRPTAPPA